MQKQCEEKIEQLILDLEDHSDQLLVTADKTKATYLEDIIWCRIIELLEVLCDKDAKELEKIAEENYKSAEENYKKETED